MGPARHPVNAPATVVALFSFRAQCILLTCRRVERHLVAHPYVRVRIARELCKRSGRRDTAPGFCAA